MPHYHVRVGDAGGALKLPALKAPKAKPAKAPIAPKAKPPAVPKPGGGQGGEGGYHYHTQSPASAKPAQPPRSPAPVAGATRLVRSAERGVNRLSAFGEEFNRDASGSRDEMGHYHFNIPTRGGAMSQDYGTSEGAQKRNTPQSHANQANLHKQAAAKHAQSGHHQAVKAHNAAAQAHGTAWRNPSIGNSQYAWGMTHRASQVRDQGVGASSWSGGKSTGYSISGTGAQSWGGGKGGSTGYKINTTGDQGMGMMTPAVSPSAGMSSASTSGGMSSTSGVSMDSGTSEGAKKAAQTRAKGGGGFSQHPLAKGVGFSIHGTEGTQRQAPQKREEPREYRGYDSRRK